MQIAALQMNSIVGDKKANFDKVENILQETLSLCGRGQGEGFDLIILPECWSIGWLARIFQENAEEIENSETIAFLSELAREYNANIIGGTLITKRSGKYFNTCPVLNRNGELIATYDKMHIFEDEKKYLSAGDSPIMVTLDGLKIGLTICYDVRFPELHRAYAKAGADMFVNVAAWGIKKPIPWEIMTRSRAVENQTYMVALTQSGQIKGNEWNLGHSRIIDYKGEILGEIKDQQEGIFCATINLKDMYKFREKWTVLNDIRDSYSICHCEEH